MSPPLVVEHLYVVEERHRRFSAALEVLPEFVLHRGEPTFHHGVVVTVTPTAHAARHPMRLDDPLVILARIRAPLVGVMQETAPGARRFRAFWSALMTRWRSLMALTAQPTRKRE